MEAFKYRTSEDCSPVLTQFFESCWPRLSQKPHIWAPRDVWPSLNSYPSSQPIKSLKKKHLIKQTPGSAFRQPKCTAPKACMGEVRIPAWHCSLWSSQPCGMCHAGAIAGTTVFVLVQEDIWNHCCPTSLVPLYKDCLWNALLVNGKTNGRPSGKGPQCLSQHQWFLWMQWGIQRGRHRAHLLEKCPHSPQMGP